MNAEMKEQIQLI